MRDALAPTSLLPWQPLGAVAPTALTDARLQLHWAVQLVSAVGTTLLPPAPDDSHTSLEWLAESDGFAGRLTAEAPHCRAVVRPADLRLYLLDAHSRIVSEHTLDGATLGQGLVWLEQEIAAYRERPLPSPLRRRALELPDHAVGRGAPFTLTDAAAFAELGRWYATADALLRAIAGRMQGAAAVRCWPHHFDIATLVTLERRPGDAAARTLGIGMSPGDAGRPEPYWYVTPWPYPDASRLPPLDGEGEWNRAGWVGAVLTGSKVVRRSGSAQATLVATFLESAVAACRALLGT
jgi:hypothetical protein